MVKNRLNGRSYIFSGNSNPTLAQRIASELEVELGKAEVTKFSDGEISVEIKQNVRTSTIFLIQSTCQPTNDNLMELLIMVDALRRSSAKTIIAVIPYYGYSRQDRRPGFSRTPISSRLVADMIESAGVDQVITIDIHSEQQQGFFHIPLINTSASPKIIQDIRGKFFSSSTESNEVVIVSPDTGGVPRARSIAKYLDCEIAIVDKRRPKANMLEVMNIIGNVKNKTCIVVDDIIDTAGTLCKAADRLKEEGASAVYAYATHPVFSGSAIENITNSALDEVVVTDTIPHDTTQFPSKIRVISVYELLAETFSRIKTKRSVSEMYT